MFAQADRPIQLTTPLKATDKLVIQSIQGNEAISELFELPHRCHVADAENGRGMLEFDQLLGTERHRQASPRLPTSATSTASSPASPATASREELFTHYSFFLDIAPDVW